jgi:glutamate dehydrogenase
VVADGDLTRKQRDELLREMTDEVAALVLRDNYQQTLAITLAESRGVRELDRHAQLIRTLERAKKLDRALEFLPDDEEIAERQAAGKGLTRPEIAVLLAYAKIVLYRQLLRSELPDEEPLLVDLLRYFPTPLVERYRDQIGRHPLRREIIATAVTNSMVNRVGPTFVQRLQADTGAAPDDVARAYAVTRDAFDLRPLWREIEALDDVVPAAVQTSMLLMAMELIERGSRWFLTRLDAPLEIGAATEAYARGIRELAGGFEEILSPEGARELEERSRELVERGVPASLAKSVARLPVLASGCDVVGIARAAGTPALDVGRLYFAVGERFGIEWLRAEAERLRGESHWQKLAIQAMIEELYNHQSDLTAAILAEGSPPGEAVDRVIDGWIEERQPAAERSQELLAELRTAGTLDHAMLAVANRRFRALLER